MKLDTKVMSFDVLINGRNCNSKMTSREDFFENFAASR